MLFETVTQGNDCLFVKVRERLISAQQILVEVSETYIVSCLNQVVIVFDTEVPINVGIVFCIGKVRLDVEILRKVSSVGEILNKSMDCHLELGHVQNSVREITEKCIERTVVAEKFNKVILNVIGNRYLFFRGGLTE